MILFVLTFLNAKLLYVALSPEDNGVYFLVMRFAMSINLIAGEWLRLTNMNLAGESSENTPKLAMNVIAYVFVLGCILFPLAFMSDILKHIFPGLSSLYIIPVIVIGLSFVLRSSYQSLLLVNKFNISYGLTSILWGTIIIVLNVFLIFVFRLGISFAVLTLFLATFVSTCWPVSVIWKKMGIAPIPSLSLFRRSGLMGGRAVIAVVGVFFMVNIHAFTIKPFSVNTELGLYLLGMFSVCFKIYQLFQRVSDVTGSVLYAHISSSGGQRGYELTAVVCRNMLWLLILLCAVAGLFGRYIIYIIASKEYYDAYIPLMFLLPGIAFMNVGSILNSSYWGRGYPRHIITAPYIVAILGYGLNRMLIPQFGATGASVSFSIVSIIWFLYLVAAFVKDSGIPLSSVLLLKWSDVMRIYTKITQKIFATG